MKPHRSLGADASALSRSREVSSLGPRSLTVASRAARAELRACFDLLKAETHDL
jgi:hypothetical protein